MFPNWKRDSKRHFLKRYDEIAPLVTWLLTVELIIINKSIHEILI